MVFQKDTALIAAVKGAGLTAREIANLLQTSPDRVRSRWGGFAFPFSETERTKIFNHCAEIIQRQTEAGALESAMNVAERQQAEAGAS